MGACLKRPRKYRRNKGRRKKGGEDPENQETT
jgi:hypothetical protein